METQRVNRLEPNKQYRILGFTNELGLGIVTVPEVIVLMDNDPIHKFYTVNYTLDGQTEVIRVTRYTEFVEIR